jgi:hypothetical protein
VRLGAPAGTFRSGDAARTLSTRRGPAVARRRITTISVRVTIVAATLAWVGFALLHSLFAVDRVDRVVEAAAGDPEVQRLVAEHLAARGGVLVPPGVEMSDESIRRIATATVADRRFVDAAKVAARAARGRLVGEPTAAAEIEGTVVAAVVRDAAVVERPDLAPALPAMPAIPVPLPVGGLPDLGPLHGFLTAAAPLGALVAIAGAVASLTSSAMPGAVVRRLGRWAVGMALVGVLGVSVLPRIGALATTRFAPGSSAKAVMAAHLTEAAFAPALNWSMLLGAAGAATLALGRTVGRRRAVEPDVIAPTPPTRTVRAPTHPNLTGSTNQC